MKRLVILLALAVACAPSPEIVYIIPSPTTEPSATPEPVNLRVYDSAWAVVIEASVARSRELDSDDAIATQVDAYNTAHTDDQWRILYGEEAVPVTNAPDATVYIVDAASHEVYFQDEVPRADLEERREAWRLSVDAWSDDRGQLVDAALYVDNVPPAPVIIATPAPDPYVIYALYCIDRAGAIMCEDHPTAEDYPRRLGDFRLTVECQNTFHPDDPWELITGRLYP